DVCSSDLPCSGWPAEPNAGGCCILVYTDSGEFLPELVMNTKILLVTGAAIILALALLWPTNTPPPEISPAENAPDTASDPAEAPLPSSDTLTPEQQALLDNPKVKAYAQRLEFEDDLHEFFANAPSLPEQERRALADALRDRMNEYEESAQMSAPEAA